MQVLRNRVVFASKIQHLALTVDSFASRMSIIEDIPAREIHDQRLKQLLDEVKDVTSLLGDTLGTKDYLLGSFSAADVGVGYQLYFAEDTVDRVFCIGLSCELSAVDG